LPEVSASNTPKLVTVPQEPDDCAKAIAAPLAELAGVVAGSEPDELLASGKAENRSESDSEPL
jgi:hypothetical protein